MTPRTPNSLPPINLSALNALTDLYYRFGNMADHALRSHESWEELDRFYIATLRGLIAKYYKEANLDAVEVGLPGEPVTLERMLPIKTIAQVTKEIADGIRYICGDFKSYNALKGGVGQPTPQEVKDAIKDVERLLAVRKQREQSGAPTTIPNVATATLRYSNQTLYINTLRVSFERDSNMDLLNDYMFTKSVDEQVDVATIEAYIAAENRGANNVGRRTIKTACIEINKKVQEVALTTLELYDTSIAHKVVRRY